MKKTLLSLISIGTIFGTTILFASNLDNDSIADYLVMSTICSSNPCSTSNYTQSNSWASSVNYNSTGDYTINFNSSYGTTPSCTCSTIDQNQGFCRVSSLGTSSVHVHTALSTSGNAGDYKFTLICVGPR